MRILVGVLVVVVHPTDFSTVYGKTLNPVNDPKYKSATTEYNESFLSRKT
jgi:hypothetical protein